MAPKDIEQLGSNLSLNFTGTHLPTSIHAGHGRDRPGRRRRVRVGRLRCTRPHRCARGGPTAATAAAATAAPQQPPNAH